MAVWAAAGVVFFVPRIYSRVCDLCSATQQEPADQQPAGVGCLIRWIRASRFYWDYSRQFWLLDLWHVSLYDSGWLAVLLSPGHLITSSSFFPWLFFALGLSVVIEMIRKVIEDVFQIHPHENISVYDYVATTPLLPGRQHADRFRPLVELSIYRIIIGALSNCCITDERFMRFDDSRVILVIVFLAFLIVIDLFGMLYLPFAFTYRLYPFNFNAPQADEICPGAAAAQAAEARPSATAAAQADEICPGAAAAQAAEARPSAAAALQAAEARPSATAAAQADEIYPSAAAAQAAEARPSAAAAAQADEICPGAAALQAAEAAPPNLDVLGLRQMDRNQIREGIICPILQTPIVHPCRPLVCPHIFERSAIVQWVQQGSIGGQIYQLCPCCRTAIIPRNMLSEARMAAAENQCLNQYE